MTSVQAFIERRRAALSDAPVRLDTLTEEAMLRDEGRRLWRAASFEGSPCFYPVYRHGDLYGFSPLDLVIAKGAFDPIPSAYEEGWRSDMIDNRIDFEAGIERVGGPPPLTGEIEDPDAYARAMADAVAVDVRDAETASPAERNVVLCGGKDSLNLLLLDWQKPVIAYSAQPNTPLVERFVRDNGLDIEVRELRDEISAGQLDQEVAENLGRVDLSNWKWTGHLCRIAEEAPTLFWKGQVADALLTPAWKRYRPDPLGDPARLRRAYAKFSGHLPAALDAPLSHGLWQALSNTLWQRAARGQGDHLGFLRGLTGSVFRSAYHGQKATAVWRSARLPIVARRDVRAVLGEALLGRTVRYPDTNPGPGPSEARRNLHGLDRVRATLREGGIAVAHH